MCEVVWFGHEVARRPKIGVRGERGAVSNCYVVDPTRKSFLATSRATAAVTIHTERLDLVPLLAETLASILERDSKRMKIIQGLDITEEFLESLDSNFISKQLDGVSARGDDADWFVRAVVRRVGATLIGHCGFHGPPAVVGRAELGYNILQPYRGNSFATEAAEGLVTWARARGVGVVVAAVEPENVASMRVLDKVGFRQTGVRVDAPGQQMRVFEIGNEPVK